MQDTILELLFYLGLPHYLPMVPTTLVMELVTHSHNHNIQIYYIRIHVLTSMRKSKIRKFA